MKDLKEYIKESILDDIDDQVENTDEMLKSVIIKWLKSNVEIIILENKLKFDFSTAPITINYDGHIKFKKHITSLTNEMFQWGVVGGYFDCSYRDSLKSLEGSPKVVKEVFDCSYCKSLKSLEGAPKEVGRYFDCSYCDSLKSLEGAPEKIEGNFNCSGCRSLKSLEGGPKKVGGYFNCQWCGLTFTKDDVKKVSKVKGKIKC